MINWQTSNRKLSEPLSFVFLLFCFFVSSLLHTVGLFVLLFLWGRDLASTCVSATEE